jgi:hypothetical protein
MNKTRAEEALEFFEAEMSRGKCYDECPQCNAMECAIEALKEHISAEKILHSFAKTVKNLSITKLIAIVKNMADL